eukprot:2569786-Alexandrium_andersonii.AAC.1
MDQERHSPQHRDLTHTHAHRSEALTPQPIQHSHRTTTNHKVINAALSRASAMTAGRRRSSAAGHSE